MWRKTLISAALALLLARSASGLSDTCPEVEYSDLARLPVSLNDIMVAMVNHAADPIWVAAWRSPKTERGWRELERLAYQLEIAGSLLLIPGTGPMDQAWTDDARWRRFALALRDAAADAVGAVSTRNVGEISSAGDAIVEICEGCHTAFKLADPTGGHYGDLSPTAGDFKD